MQIAYPGVFRQELRNQRQTAQAASTANFAIVGSFEKGPVNTPILVQSFEEFTRVFGSFLSTTRCPTQISSYYDNGGQNAVVVRVVGAGALQAEAEFFNQTKNQLVATSSAGAPIVVNEMLGDDVVPGSVRLFMDDSIAVSADVIGATTASTGPYNFTASNAPIVPGSLTVTYRQAGPIDVVLTDDGVGGLTGPTTETGTINYLTGAIQINNLVTPDVADVDADYEYFSATLVSGQTVAPTVEDQRVYHGTLRSGLVPGSVNFNWVDSSSMPQNAVANAAGVISGDATGTVNHVTGEVVISLTNNPVGVDELLTADYFYHNFEEATDDGLGVISGPLFSGPAVIDYATGLVTGTITLPAPTRTGAKLRVDYKLAVQKSEARNPGEFADSYRMRISPDVSSLDVANLRYARYNVEVLDTSGPNIVSLGTYSNVVIDDLSSPRHIAQIINDQFAGSLDVAMVDPVSDDVPDGLEVVQKTGVLVGTGNGATALSVVKALPVADRGEIIPGTLVINYLSGAIQKEITDNAMGNLIGDVDLGSTATVDYETGIVVFTTSDTVDADPVEASYLLPALGFADALYEGGLDGAAPVRADLVGAFLEPNYKGIFALKKFQNLFHVAMPDFAGDPDADRSLLTFLTNRGDGLAILTTPLGSTPRQAANYKRYGLNSSNERGAMYYPWIKIEDPLTGLTQEVPPFGHVAGVFSRTDLNRNVGKAPAGTQDGILRSLRGLAVDLTDDDLATLFAAQINALWQPPEADQCVWGVRTLDPTGEYRYINRRRTVDAISLTVSRALYWAVFETNGPALWAQIKAQVRGILMSYYRQGVLAGSTPEEAFYIVVDATNNPPEQVNQGILVLNYGVATQTPNEFLQAVHKQILQGGAA